MGEGHDLYLLGRKVDLKCELIDKDRAESKYILERDHARRPKMKRLETLTLPTNRQTDRRRL